MPTNQMPSYARPLAAWILGLVNRSFIVKALGGHNRIPAAVLGKHAVKHQTGGDDALTATIDSNARVGVRKNSAGSTFLRRRLNLIEGANVTLTVADDAVDEEVDVTIAGAAAGGLGWYNVKDYGAVGDGATDDTTACQDAADACHAAGGGVLYFPVGTYSCSTLTLTHDCQIVGDGTGLTIIKARGAATLLDFPADVAIAEPATSIRDLTVHGNDVATRGISVIQASFFRLDRVWIRNVAGSGLYLRGVLVGYVYSSNFIYNQIGVDMDEYGAYQANLMRYIACGWGANTTYALKCVNGMGLVIYGGDFEVNGTQGNAATGGIYFRPEGAGVGLVVQDTWFEFNNGLADVIVDTPDAAGSYSVIQDCFLLEDGHTSYAVYVNGTVRANSLVGRMCRFYASGAADWYADGASATILLTECNGTTGGAGTVTVGAIHGAVTLGADADTLLGLSGQALSLDTQSANRVLAGPTSGAAADPTFRALVAADLGSGTPDGTKFLRDDLSWQAAAGVTTLDGLTDVVITAPAASQVLRYDGSYWRNSALHWEPLTNGDPDTPELLFTEDGDVLMGEVT